MPLLHLVAKRSVKTLTANQYLQYRPIHDEPSMMAMFPPDKPMVLRLISIPQARIPC